MTYVQQQQQQQRRHHAGWYFFVRKLGSARVSLYYAPCEERGCFPLSSRVTWALDSALCMPSQTFVFCSDARACWVFRKLPTRPHQKIMPSSYNDVLPPTHAVLVQRHKQRRSLFLFHPRCTSFIFFSRAFSITITAQRTSSSGYFFFIHY